MTPEHVASAVAALSGEAVLEVRQLSGGSGSPSWKVMTAAGMYAARLYAAEPPAHSQAQLLTYLARERFGVPEVVFVGTHQAHHLLALSWVEGLTIADALRAQPDSAWELGHRFGERQARLHAVPVTPELRAVLHRVKAPGLATGTEVLVHLDYHLLNVMIDSNSITGVIDWENVHLGDARFDVARSLSILCVDPNIRTLPRTYRQVIRTFRQGYLDGYCATQPVSLTSLAPFLAWAGQFMLDDLRHRLDSQAAARIERWSRWWRARAEDRT